MSLKKLILSGNTGLRLCLFLCAFLLAVPASSYAQPESPCDPEYMDALEARAWMEAQREIAQNKNFIFKPDSVLEYTCFDRFLNEAASNFGDRQFSETSRWGGPPAGFSSTSTDNALNQVVLAPVNAYLRANFTSGGFDAGTYLNNRTGFEYSPGNLPNVNGSNYTCDEMQRVWQAARCMNFNEQIPQNQTPYDGFFDFQYYVNNDPRNEAEPWELMCSPDPRFGNALKSAYNDNQDWFSLTEAQEILPAEGNAAPYLDDDVITYLDYILPGTCNGPAIPTGITVERPDITPTSYEERVCPNPGCTSNPNTGTCNQ